MSLNCFFLKSVYVCSDPLVLQTVLQTQAWEASIFQTLISAAPVYKERQGGPRDNRTAHKWTDYFVSSAVSLACHVEQHI